MLSFLINCQTVICGPGTFFLSLSGQGWVATMSAVYVHVMHVLEPDALLTGAGPGAAVSHCFPWQRLAAPRGPCHKGSSVTH